MTPAERAEFDRNYRPPARESAQGETECITPAEARLSPAEALQMALASLQQPPWACTTSNARTDTKGHGFDYRCRTPANAQAEGKARFELVTDRRYRSEIDGRSQVVDNTTGKAVDTRMVSARALTTGNWQAERCTP